MTHLQVQVICFHVEPINIHDNIHRIILRGEGHSLKILHDHNSIKDMRSVKEGIVRRLSYALSNWYLHNLSSSKICSTTQSFLAYVNLKFCLLFLLNFQVIMLLLRSLIREKTNWQIQQQLYRPYWQLDEHWYPLVLTILPLCWHHQPPPNLVYQWLWTLILESFCVSQQAEYWCRIPCETGQPGQLVRQKASLPCDSFPHLFCLSTETKLHSLRPRFNWNQSPHINKESQ